MKKRCLQINEVMATMRKGFHHHRVYIIRLLLYNVKKCGLKKRKLETNHLEQERVQGKLMKWGQYDFPFF